MRIRSISNAMVTLATAGSVIPASPVAHQHGHIHIDKRTVKVVDVPGPTVIAYELNGKLIDQTEVCEGLEAGTLKFANESDDHSVNCAEPASASSVASSVSAALSKSDTSVTIIATTSVTPSLTHSAAALPGTVDDFDKEAIKVASTVGAKTLPTPIPSSVENKASPTVTSSPISDSASGGQGLDIEFPDGQIDCTTFPSDYGPIKIDWAGLGGWSGIQYVTIEGDTVTHIDTAVPGGEGCKPNAMCSYACPAGYQKSQWPPQQGATGQSVGGISCNSNGKLALTNPGLSKFLCVKGTGAVTVQNKLSNNAAICRTDYPGTEDEVVPLNTQPDTTNPLTCPDAATYFQHDGDPTSAQYYINNQGVALHNACTWGSDGSDMGNWAPSYLGVGQDLSGKTFLSIASTAQNNPRSYSPLNFTVKIAGDTSGTCALSNGKYCSGNSYENCNEQGCTVELISGKATYVLADDLGLSY